jgi:two-component system sensor histidine kinase FlrB
LFAELIEEDGEGRSEWISNLRAGIRSLAGTVNNVLSFHGSGSLTLTPLSLPALIGDAIRFAEPLANQASVSLEWLAADDAIQVMGNESALRQVILNLLSNAIRHTPADGKVTVSVRYENTAAKSERQKKSYHQVIAEFSDTGCGIRPDQIDHIFEPGFSGRGDSSGLGLAVCERIMLQHGGRISAANRAGSGAQFKLHFPISKMESVTA